MKLKKLNIARVAGSFVAAFAMAVVPFASASAATNVWNGTTNLDFGTATNWSTGAVPLDGDSIVFNSTNTTTAYPATATSLTNATGNAFAGLTAQGTTGSYNFTINALKTAANATLSASDATATTRNNIVTITALTANGNVTLDGVNAGTINLPSGGIVTLKNETSLPTSITGATGIILDNDGSVTSANILNFNHTNVTLTGTTNATTLALTADSLAANYPLTIGGTSILTLPANITISTPVTMTAGQIKMSAAGTTTISTLNITTAQSQYVLPSTAYLYATTYNVTSPGTFVAGFGNAGTFTGVSTTTTTTSPTTTTTGTGATATTPTTSTTTATTTPKSPNTAFGVILANPLMIAAATVAIVIAGFGILKYRKLQQ